ncbi:MAG TPA: glycoside hydrolase family 16 protein [Candidatus Krumholzibacteria bacterium]|nr:glycoside hydrolase family 16 protein [Candidatus Krumholzibacteria bacterium]HPD70209.1 glycoside hydrolase family 16 protein [Candidatus Krumholzibacteria bacterium]HRY40091.1 glycoside hydrolase family 16 protein [Candidatus Krumholzibacteria bacterium]
MTHRLAASAVAIGALALAFAGGGCSSSDPGPEEITLLWQDDFDGPAGQLPDPARWRFDVGTDWGNDQLEYDTARPENVSLDGDGNLAITAREEAYEGCAYTSGRIKTQGLFGRARGRFEARIRLPVGQGLWPAFWLLGDNVATVGWPACGEIDIMEYRGQEPNVVHGSLHGPGYSGGAAITGRFTLPGDGFDAGFHVFAIEWDETRITWLVDDLVYQRRGIADLPSGAPWVFNRPFFILLNVAVGGNYVGAPDASTQFPQTMLVDWVRVHGVPD